jgi:hypothetical protein
VVFAVHVHLVGRNVAVLEKNTEYRLMHIYKGGAFVYARILSPDTGQNRNIKARQQFFEEGKNQVFVNDDKWVLPSWKILTACCIAQR